MRTQTDLDRNIAASSANSIRDRAFELNTITAEEAKKLDAIANPIERQKAYMPINDRNIAARSSSVPQF